MQRRFFQYMCLIIGLVGLSGFSEVQSEIKAVNGRNLSDQIHIVATVSENDISEGKQITIEYRMYVSQDIGISNWTMLVEPKYEGFELEVAEQEGLKVEMAKFNGETYRMVVLKTDTLLSKRPGLYILEPLQLSVTVEIPDVDANKKEDVLGIQMKQMTSTFISNTLKINVI
ncbi:hypothetical protein [Psychroserpens sp.]|uniref:hypothetical protein n=1 Tax=Psychroserpens sp. TaxID=2020870 RepID=UPI003C758A25